MIENLIEKKTKILNLIRADEVREIVLSNKTKVESIDVDFADDSIETDSIVIEINESFINKKKLKIRKKLKKKNFDTEKNRKLNTISI